MLKQMHHHQRGLQASLPHLVGLLITHGLLGQHTLGSPSQRLPFAHTPEQRGQQLMSALASSELPASQPGKANLSLLHLSARQYHLGAAVKDALAQVCASCLLQGLADGPCIMLCAPLCGALTSGLAPQHEASEPLHSTGLQ